MAIFQGKNGYFFQNLTWSPFSQFHQHFKSTFLPNILFPKNYKAQTRALHTELKLEYLSQNSSWNLSWNLSWNSSRNEFFAKKISILTSFFCNFWKPLFSTQKQGFWIFRIFCEIPNIQFWHHFFCNFRKIRNRTYSKTRENEKFGKFRLSQGLSQNISGEKLWEAL